MYSRTWGRAIAALAFVVTASAVGGAHAQAQEPALKGEFVLARDRSDDINGAIEQSIASLPFFVRPIARGRLRKTNEYFQSLRFTQEPGSVSIVTDGGPPIVTPVSGAVVRWRRDDGETFAVSTVWRERALEQSFDADDGKRVNLYSLGDDGATLSMRVTITAPRLPRPVVYTLRYRRAGPTGS